MNDLLIVGAGPAGLAIAIAASQAGLDYEVLEKGVLVNSIFHFPRSMVFFTTPELLEIGGLPFVTPYEKPTQWEALRYYRRVTDSYGLRVAFGERVRALGRDDGGFSVTTATPQGEVARRARNVAVATGYYDHPNRLEVPGEDLPHVFHYYDEPHPYYRRRVLVVGGKNSAAIAALELHRAGASVTLVHHHSELGKSIKYWIRPDIENRIKEGSVAALFETHVLEITPDVVVVEHHGVREEIPADQVFLLTGYHPDVNLMSRAGIRCDPHSYKPELNGETFETNVPNLFIAGGAIAGKHTGSIFIENGRFHGEKIIEVIAGRLSGLQAPGFGKSFIE
jgi:thioredoxin reductase (NADPH)